LSKLNVLTALLAVAFVALWFTVSNAEDPTDSCKAECARREALCIEACGQESNPMECESACRDEAWDCRSSC
jgi:hypothetical protein